MDNLATEEVVDQTSSTGDVQPFADLEPETSDETAEQPAPSTEETTPETESASEEAAYQLPDEQSKVFTEQTIQEYAQARYPKYAALLTDQNTPEPTREAVRQMMHDALNKDIYIEKQRVAAEQTEEEEAEPEAEKEPTLDATEQAKQWETQVTTFVDNVTSPEVAQQFFKDLNAATALKDPKEQAIQFTKVLSKGMVNLLKDALPAFLFGAEGQPGQLDQYIESRYEGLGEMHANSSRATAWDDIRDSDPAYASLPDYGTKEWLEGLTKAQAMVPGIENAIFTDKNGRPLSRSQQFIEKSKLAAKLMSGTATQATVAVASKAVETGKKLGVESARRKQNANLGAGHSKGQIAAANLSPVDQARKDSIARLRADENPFVALNQQS